MTDRMSREARSRVMAAVKSKWTAPEVEFKGKFPGAERGEWLPHSPDFALFGFAVYVEGSDFWRGDVPRRRWDSMAEAWRGHLFRNRVRLAARAGFWAAVADAAGLWGSYPREFSLDWEPGEGWV